MNYSRGLIIKFSSAEMKEFISTDNKTPPRLHVKKEYRRCAGTLYA